MGYVSRTKVALLDTVFEKVLSKTSANIPPSFCGTSYLPVDTLLASQAPYHEMGLRPKLFSFSTAVDCAFRAGCGAPDRSSGFSPGVGGASKVEEGSFGAGAFSEPGCLKMPKLIDFLSGLTLQEIVCSALTLTQRTRYDC